MNSLAALLFPAILLAAPYRAAPEREAEAVALAPAPDRPEPAVSAPPVADVWEEMADAFRPTVQQQVRIERRVIIRISPQRTTVATDMMSALPQGELPERLKERKFGRCLPARSIVGVQGQSDNRLLLFLRDRRILMASLEKSCHARDFYSGSYVQLNEDGLVCAGRDKLHSRSGASCDLQKFRELVVDRR